MNILIRIFRWFFTQSLKLYPKAFRTDFGDEMVFVFEEAITSQQDWKCGTSLFLREFRALPGSLLHAYLVKWLRRGSSTMIDEYISPAPRRQALLGILPFMAFGISSMIGKSDNIFLPNHQYAEMAVYGLALVGLLIGWIRGFPLWSYSYLGWSLLLAWSNTNISIHGVHWGYQVWIPFGITILIALLWTRSFIPIKKLLWDCWNDWTRLSLTMFALSSWILMVYDENHHPQLLLFILATMLVVSAGAWLFLRSSSLFGRVLSIVVGFIAATVPMGISYLTWDWRTYYGLPQSEFWYDNLGIAPIGILFWLLFLFWPALIAPIQRLIIRRTI